MMLKEHKMNTRNLHILLLNYGKVCAPGRTHDLQIALCTVIMRLTRCLGADEIAKARLYEIIRF